MAEENGTFKDSAKYRANNKYIKDNYKQVKLSMPYTEADALNLYCKKHKLTVAGLIRGLIKNEIGYDSIPFRVEIIPADGNIEVVGNFANIEEASQEAKKLSEKYKKAGDKETKIHLTPIID